ncbi:hypothetical protein LNP74_00630 [Klebsiella pneumoniae subsp. pneumoniae]|nr:hypothetical protein [Klebsiella pneumoniae subsp. pneumoniae]
MPGILLLTATPGTAGNGEPFCAPARPCWIRTRFHDFEQFVEEQQNATVRWPTPSRCCWRATS